MSDNAFAPGIGRGDARLAPAGRNIKVHAPGSDIDLPETGRQVDFSANGLFASTRNEQGQSAMIRAHREERRSERQIEIRKLSIHDTEVIDFNRVLFEAGIAVKFGVQIT